MVLLPLLLFSQIPSPPFSSPNCQITSHIPASPGLCLKDSPLHPARAHPGLWLLASIFISSLVWGQRPQGVVYAKVRELIFMTAPALESVKAGSSLRSASPMIAFHTPWKGTVFLKYSRCALILLLESLASEMAAAYHTYRTLWLPLHAKGQKIRGQVAGGSGKQWKTEKIQLRPI